LHSSKAKTGKKTGRKDSARGRVFIIGAGVSAACGIAVANQILREAVMKMESRDSAKTDQIHALLQYLYPNFDTRIRNYPNIEDFLNLLEMATKFNSEEFIASKLWSRPRLEEVKRLTLKAVTDYIWDRMGDSAKQRVVHEFVRQSLREGDTIITFNWDLTFERALENYPGDPGFLYTYSQDRDEKHFSLLKPHGSIDWFDKAAVKGLVLQSELGSLDKKLCYYPRFDRAKHPKLVDIPPIIVPPLAEKDFKIDFLKRTWRFVYRAVSNATELHIIGYSLPREDQFARLVFRRAILNNVLNASKRKKRGIKVCVVNPDPTAEGTFSRLVGRSVRDFEFRQALFEDYVAGLQE
jgi:hypothetical protein